MILKKLRLTEREVKKVLQKGKPFFSYGIVLNQLPNTQGFHRFGIVIGGKSTKTAVSRNFFRRKLYAAIQEKILSASPAGKNAKDFVFVVKKKTKLDVKEEASIKSFEQDISFLFKNINK